MKAGGPPVAALSVKGYPMESPEEDILRTHAILLALLVTACAVPSFPARAEETVRADFRAGLEPELTRVAESLDRMTGYAIKDLATGETFLRFPGTVFPQASPIKIAILLGLMRQAQQGDLSLEEKHAAWRSETLRQDRDTSSAKRRTLDRIPSDCETGSRRPGDTVWATGGSSVESTSNIAVCS